MQTSAKAEDYKGALEPWRTAYEECPASSKNIYIYGPRIFKASMLPKPTGKRKSILTKLWKYTIIV